MAYDPTEWLTSATRSLNDYLESRISEVADGNGLDAYEIIMEYPAAAELPRSSEFTKTLIHFGIDDIVNTNIGIGENIFDTVITDGTQDVAGTIVGHQGMRHEINFDVGIWASDFSGGLTSRLRAYEYLTRFLQGEIARQKCLAFTDGVEIVYYRSGRFVTETINDTRVFRVVGAELEVRVFSYDSTDADTLIDGEPILEPELEITDNSGSLVPLTDES